MFRRLLYSAAVLASLSGSGHAGPSEYNNGGRDMYGNTAEQNEAVRLRGAEEKASFAREKTRKEKAENDAQLYSLIPGAALVIVLVIGGVVVTRRRG